MLVPLSYPALSAAGHGDLLHTQTPDSFPAAEIGGSPVYLGVQYPVKCLQKIWLFRDQQCSYGRYPLPAFPS